MTATKTKFFDREMGRLTLILFAFSAITALLLGFVNYITADRIAESKRAATEAAMRAVLSADTYEKLDYTGGDANVVDIYRAGDAGYVVECSVSGSQAMIGMVVGVDKNGAVTGIGITSSSETSGLGANASASTEVGVDFRAQFVGATGELAVKADGGTIDALTGATVTSRAVTSGVNSALAAVAALG